MSERNIITTNYGQLLVRSCPTLNGQDTVISHQF